MELKDTLTMPKTSFEMRGNLPKKEPEFQKRWNEMNLYNQILKKNFGKPRFMLHDGPPYANGDIHCGHAMNKVLKDFVIRYKSMSGFYTPFIPGWDTHGLPIETVLQKKGINRKEIDIVEYRKLCEKYALEQVEKQKNQFLKLAVLGEFDNPYMTLQHTYEAVQIKVFADMAMSGLIFKGKKPVFWSPSSESALAEAEIEYQDVTSYSIYVAFKVSKKNAFLDGDESFIIWTTTPWTIPANLAICLNPNYEYGVFETDKGVFIFLKEFADSLKEKLGFNSLKLRKTLKGKDLEYVEAKHPFYDRNSLVILGNHVTNDAGTGCVHTAPGHGEDDFFVGQKYGLPTYCPVDSRGFMMKDAGPELEGMFYEKANDKVLEILNNTGALLGSEKMTHSYPHDWRTKKPVIFRATDQWFCSIDKIREKLLSEIKDIKWFPSWGEVRLANMIANRGDWCISRQRAWGVPITIIYAEDGTPIFDKKLFDHFVELFRKYGSNIWFEKTAEELLPEGYTNPLSPNGKYKKETDIMDVWFDSGSSHTSVLVERGYKYPFDLYLEGSDQYRGWFNSSLIIGTAINNCAPYKTCVSHGFVLDGKGNKMSKSLGNTIDPNKIIANSGADILRLWVASVDYQSDVRISDEIIKQAAEQYRKIRNTFRFLVGNLGVKGSLGYFDITKNNANDFDVVDSYILEKLKIVTNNCLYAYDNYDFSTVTTEIMNFMSIDLSSFYLDLTKDVLYCDEYDSHRRRQVQTVLYKTLFALLRLLAPILPHTCEEIYDLWYDRNKESVHLLDMPKKEDNIDKILLEEYSLVLKLRSDILKALEEARTSSLIGSSQEATLDIEILDKDVERVFKKFSYQEKIRLFIVSSLKEINNLNANKYDVCKVLVKKDGGEKCERCWNRFPKGELNEQNICPRCQEAVLKASKWEEK